MARDVDVNDRTSALDTHGNFRETSRAGDCLRQMLGVGRRAVASACSINRRSRCSLCDIAAVQEDAGLDDPKGHEYQDRPENRPLHAFADAALIAGRDLHSSELGELGADIDRDQSDHDPGHCNGAGEQNGILI